MIKNRKIGKKRKNWQIKKFSKSDPNHGANERPKGEPVAPGEPVALGDLKASSGKRYFKTSTVNNSEGSVYIFSQVLITKPPNFIF